MAETKPWIGSSGGPTLEPILEIHRGMDSFIQFSRKETPDDPPMPIAHVRVSELKDWFPEFRAELFRDSYYSLNSFYRAGTAKTSDLRYLNAAYADLDYYKANITFGRAFGLIVDAQKNGVIPPATFIVDSGKGFWLLYVLKSRIDPGQPERYFRHNPFTLSLYRQVQNALHKRIREVMPELQPDPKAMDASRITRIPDSINSGSGRAVAYWVQKDNLGKGYIYTLPSLITFFGLDSENENRTQRKSWESFSQIPNNSKGYRALYSGRLEDLEILRMMRKGFQRGHRNYAALVYSILLRGLKIPPSEIRSRIFELGAECNPPLSRQECQHAINSSETLYRFSDNKLINCLKISGSELQQLSMIKANRHLRRKAGPKRGASKKQRQALILELISTSVSDGGFSGHVPTCRSMSEELEKRGFIVSHVTISRDYKDLRISSKQDLRQLELSASPYIN